MTSSIPIFIGLVFLFGLVSKWVVGTIITAPIVFTAVPLVLVLVYPEQFEAVLHIKSLVLIGEIALALILFADATRINIRRLVYSAYLPARLLGIGLPLTILLGMLVGRLLFPNLLLWETAILAVILAPTDSGVGNVIVNSPRIPERIRQALSVESGLNDGIIVPILTLFITLSEIEKTHATIPWVEFAFEQIGFGLLAGIVLGGVGGLLLLGALRRGWVTPIFEKLTLLALAILTWYVANLVGGNGFIAAFVGGFAVKLTRGDAGETLGEFIEAEGQLISYAVFFIFGLIAGELLGGITVIMIVYAFLSLTVIRMLPVAIALIGKQRFAPTTTLFLGWFGPRGLASIVLALLFLKEETALPGEDFILLTVTATVLLSVFAHGITAAPAIRVYTRVVKQLKPSAPELDEPAHVITG